MATLPLHEVITCQRATEGCVDDKAGVWSVKYGNQPRVSDKGLLVEESRTNYIPNSSMIGAVLGSPGAVPFWWAGGDAIGGVTRTIVGVGVENGVDYMDVRFNGTAPAAMAVHFQIGSAAVAAGQLWTLTIFQKLVAGTLTNVSEFCFLTNIYSSVPVFLGQPKTPLAIPTATLTRSGGVFTVQANGVRADPHYTILCDADGGPIDFTVRIGWPQFERGAFQTSPIRTSAGVPVTRAADIITVNNPAAVINREEQTLFFEMTPLTPPALATAPLAQVGWTANQGLANSVTMATENIPAGHQGAIVYSGALANVIDIGIQPTTRYKAALGVGPNNTRGALNGALGAADVVLTMPLGNPQRATIGSAPFGMVNFGSGYYHTVWFIPSRQTDQFLENQTWRPEFYVGTTFSPTDSAVEIVLSNNNMTCARNASGAPSYRTVRSTRGHNAGKRYFEMKHDLRAAVDTISMGLATQAWQVSQSPPNGWLGQTNQSIGVFDAGYAEGGPGTYNDTGIGFAVNEWVGFAIDLDTGKFWYRDSAGWAGDPFAGTDPVITFTPNMMFFAAVSHWDVGYQVTAKFGGQFAYRVPDGFGSWDPGK